MVKLGVPHPKYHVLLRHSVVSRETIFKIKCLFVRVLSFFFLYFFFLQFGRLSITLPWLLWNLLIIPQRNSGSKRFCVNVKQVLSDLHRGPTGLFRRARSLASTKSIVKKERSLIKKLFPESRRVNVKCIFSISPFFHLTSNELVCSLREMFLKQSQYSRLASAAIPVEKIYWIDQSDARLPEARLTNRTWCMRSLL